MWFVMRFCWDDESRSDTYPTIEVDAKHVTMGHEASVSKIGEDQLFYLMARGLSEDEANALIVTVSWNRSSKNCRWNMPLK
jgi:Fe-S cluster assembly scaffold protein SufB